MNSVRGTVPSMNLLRLDRFTHSNGEYLGISRERILRIPNLVLFTSVVKFVRGVIDYTFRLLVSRSRRGVSVRER